MIQKRNDKYRIEIYAHDPYGGGKPNYNDAYILYSLIKKQVQQQQPTSRFNPFQLNWSPYTQARQPRGDYTSCGAIMCADMVKRIKGEELNSQTHPIDASDLLVKQWRICEEFKKKPLPTLLDKN